MKLYDNHIHLLAEDLEDPAAVLADFDAAKIEKFTFLGVSNPHKPLNNENAQGLLFKRLFGDRMFYFPGCDYAFAREGANEENVIDFPEQVRRMHALGADGWKFLESKPGLRLEPLDGPFYQPLFNALEHFRLPVLWHVGDPIEFWDVNTLPAWAFPEWSYDDTVPGLESLREEALNVVKRHPKLPFILAHFFFMGEELDRACALLDAHPNVMFDLTPGVEMFFGFSKDIGKSREVFTRYADRILFGTDRGVAHMPALGRKEMIVRFLSTEDRFDPPHSDIVMWPDDRSPIRGIGLAEEAVARICRENLIELLGTEPKPFNEELAKQEVRRLAAAHGEHSMASNILDRW